MSELLRGRRFEVWDYCVSHPTLLIRSFETDDAPNIDLMFQSVRYFEGPFALGEIELQEPTEAERARVRQAAKGKEERIWAIQGTQGRALVAAAGFDIAQNRHGALLWRLPHWDGRRSDDVLEAEIAPVDPREREALLEELAAIADFPLYNHAIDTASGRIVLRGGGEAFDLGPWFMTREHRIDVRIGPARVLHREALARPASVDETHKTSGVRAAFARVLLTFEPKLRGTGASFHSQVVGGAVPDACLAGVAKGVWGALAAGPLGWPVADVAIVLRDGAFHDTDSSPEAFAAAAGAACCRAFREAGTVLLEPMIRVEIATPARYLEAVCEDLVARRGRVLDKGWSGERIDLVARAPLVDMLGYGDVLRVRTEGTGYHSMRVDGWEPIDPSKPPRFRPAAALRAVV